MFMGFDLEKKGEARESYIYMCVCEEYQIVQSQKKGACLKNLGEILMENNNAAILLDNWIEHPFLIVPHFHFFVPFYSFPQFSPLAFVMEDYIYIYICLRSTPLLTQLILWHLDSKEYNGWISPRFWVHGKIKIFLFL